MLDRLFIDYSTAKLSQLEGRIAASLDSLSPDQVWSRHGEHENAVGNLVLHLCGNVRQWIVAGVGGAPDIRTRDAEFAVRDGPGSTELRGRLHDTVGEAVAVIQGLSERQLARRVVIQGYDVSVLEAVYHVVEHFSMHTGQILFAVKMLTGADLGFYRHLGGKAHSQKTP